MSIDTIGPNIFLQKHPLSMMGCKLGKVVTIIKLESGKTVIHSTASFSKSDIGEIRDLGEPEFLLVASNFHDTYANAGRNAFPDIPYFVPANFPNSQTLGATGISEFKGEDELKIIEIKGMPKLNEFAIFHRPSKTLIIADLIFNLSDSVGAWTKWFLKTTVKLDSFPGQSAFLRRFIEDEAAYRESLAEIAELDFEKIIVGHGEPVIADAKAVFKRVLL